MSKPDQNFIFNFYRYVQPIWYFNLRARTACDHYWLDYRTLTPDEQKLIELDNGYEDEAARLRDAAYQAWQKGFVDPDGSKSLTLSGKPSTKDEYRFVRKYFHPIWSVYILLIRLIALHNPLCEIAGWWCARRVRRSDLFLKVLDRNMDHATGLIEQRPLVSIVIPTLNRYQYLKDVLSDLELQDYKNHEVIVVDQSEPFQPDFYKGWDINLHVVHQEEKALWKARNHAIRISRGEFVLLYDDDSRVDPDWISAHLRGLDFFNADFSAGVSLSVIGARIPENYAFFRWADQFDTGNALIRKDVFRKIGLFDRQFEKQRMGDGEFGLRAYLAGFRGISNPHAKRIHLKVETGGLRQMGSWDGFRPTKWFAPRPIPSVLYLTRRYFGTRLAILDLLIKVPASILPLSFKRKPAVLVLAAMLSICIFPVVMLQVFASWRRASKMIEQGPKIESLD